MNGITVNARFLRWVTEIVRKGVDGEVVIELLKEREVDLARDECHFAQKIKNNEIGTLMDKDGQIAELLDFYKACKYGYTEEVDLYCRCNALLDEEKLDLLSGVRSTPLMLAAMNGHTDVIKILCKYGANVNKIDRTGRSALHYAAKNGHALACSQLVRFGAMIFASDFHGNTPLHLAAMFNRPDAVKFLAGWTFFMFLL